MKSLLSILASLFFFVGCASVGAVIDSGKDFTTGFIDSSVNAVGGVTVAALEDVSDITTTAASVAGGVVKTVGDEIDKQTDELQDTPKKD